MTEEEAISFHCPSYAFDVAASRRVGEAFSRPNEPSCAHVDVHTHTHTHICASLDPGSCMDDWPLGFAMPASYLPVLIAGRGSIYSSHGGYVNALSSRAAAVFIWRK